MKAFEAKKLSKQSLDNHVFDRFSSIMEEIKKTSEAGPEYLYTKIPISSKLLKMLEVHGYEVNPMISDSRGCYKISWENAESISERLLTHISEEYAKGNEVKLIKLTQREYDQLREELRPHPMGDRIAGPNGYVSIEVLGE